MLAAYNLKSYLIPITEGPVLLVNGQAGSNRGSHRIARATPPAGAAKEASALTLQGSFPMFPGVGVSIRCRRSN